ncbi:hypothetical protein ACQPW3_32130 [Actinosynnema sp. CA-248983]
MLRRLLALIVPLLVALVAALGVPLAFAVVQSEGQETYLDRLGDASRFASLAENALASNRRTALREEMIRYDQLYGIAAALVSTDRTIVESSRQPFPSPTRTSTPASKRRSAATGAKPTRPSGRGTTSTSSSSNPSGGTARWSPPSSPSRPRAACGRRSCASGAC